MKQRKTGEFYGETNQTIHLDGLTLTDTVYTLDKVDWHYHENPYFTFLLQGKLIEGNKKEVYHCPAGTLLFHHWQDPHYNIKPAGHTRGFHLELQQNWFDDQNIPSNTLQGSVNLQDPQLKQLMYRILKEVKLDGVAAGLAINSLLNELLNSASADESRLTSRAPTWVAQLRELLHDGACCHQWTLTELARQINIHPVHLSRDFSRYFNCGLGDYIRTLKLQNSLVLLSKKDLSLTTIGLQCGFADQSHFIRSFKSVYGITPLHYRKLI